MLSPKNTNDGRVVVAIMPHGAKVVLPDVTDPAMVLSVMPDIPDSYPELPIPPAEVSGSNVDQQPVVLTQYIRTQNRVSFGIVTLTASEMR